MAGAVVVRMRWEQGTAELSVGIWMGLILGWDAIVGAAGACDNRNMFGWKKH